VAHYNNLNEAEGDVERNDGGDANYTVLPIHCYHLQVEMGDTCCFDSYFEVNKDMMSFDKGRP
jgi:hypothetical protein